MSAVNIHVCRQLIFMYVGSYVKINVCRQLRFVYIDRLDSCLSAGKIKLCRLVKVRHVDM